MTTILTDAVTREIEHDCARLALRFAELVDSARYTELSELFASNGVFYRPAEPNKPMTVAALVDSYRLRLGPHVSMHLVTNVVITAESAVAASGSARILFFAAPRDAVSEVGRGREATMQLVGRFSDRFVRTAQGWRFAERRGEMLFNV